MASTLHLKIIACEVAQREIGHVAARSPSILDMEFLPVGNHNEPKKGHAELQARIDAVPQGRYDAILVGYGLCNLILSGVTARHTPLVVPRAHDCITLFLGSRERYETLFAECPGTYYFTPGWLDFSARRARAEGKSAPEAEMASQVSTFTLGGSFEEMVSKYGEDNARYLMEVAQSWTQSYQRTVLIRFEFDRDLKVRERVGFFCQRNGWRLDEVEGDLSLLKRWIDGEWDSREFLMVPPGQTIHPSYDHQVVKAQPATA